MLHRTEFQGKQTLLPNTKFKKFTGEAKKSAWKQNDSVQAEIFLIIA